MSAPMPVLDRHRMGTSSACRWTAVWLVLTVAPATRTLSLARSDKCPTRGARRRGQGRVVRRMCAGRSRGELASGALTAPSTPGESRLGACVVGQRSAGSTQMNAGGGQNLTEDSCFQRRVDVPALAARPVNVDA